MVNVVFFCRTLMLYSHSLIHTFTAEHWHHPITTRSCVGVSVLPKDTLTLGWAKTKPVTFWSEVNRSLSLCAPRTLHKSKCSTCPYLIHTWCHSNQKAKPHRHLLGNDGLVFVLQVALYDRLVQLVEDLSGCIAFIHQVLMKTRSAHEDKQHRPWE